MKKTVNNITIEKEKHGYNIYYTEDGGYGIFIPDNAFSDLEACIHKIKGEVPMGVSQWMAHGKKYGYDKFYQKTLPKPTKEFTKFLKELGYIMKPKKIKKAKR